VFSPTLVSAALRDIGQVADPVPGELAEDAVMPIRIQLTLTGDDPPVGTARRSVDADTAGAGGQAETRDFVGWLGLLRVLSQLIGSCDESAELDPEPGPG
jgi:hypothetical protein